jgi:hypothetical protein
MSQIRNKVMNAAMTVSQDQSSLSRPGEPFADLLPDAGAIENVLLLLQASQQPATPRSEQHSTQRGPAE